jgi:hypothetical protein
MKDCWSPMKELESRKERGGRWQSRLEEELERSLYNYVK